MQELFDEIDELKNNLESSKTNYQKELKDLFKDFKTEEDDTQEEVNNKSSEDITCQAEDTPKSSEQPIDNQFEEPIEESPEDDDVDNDLEIIEYKGIEYIVIDEIMYPYNDEDGSKGEAFGTYKDGKVKKISKFDQNYLIFLILNK